MKIHRTLGIVLAAHIVAFAILLFAIQGCSSTTKSVPPSVDGTADNASPAGQSPASIEPTPVAIASPSPAGADLNPAITPTTPTVNFNGGSALYSPTRPGTPAAAAIESSAPANVMPVATYVVVKGDSLSKIAVKYHLTRSELAKANGLKADATIKIGQKLIIPGKAPAAAIHPAGAAATDNVAAGGTTYKVKPGDSLKLIAKHNGTTVSVLRSLNHLKGDNVRVGQLLKLPAGSPSAVSAPEVSAPMSEATPAPDVVATAPARGDGGRVTHTVKAGEKLSTIAKKYGVTVGELATANNISDPSKIRAGQELVIPNGSASSGKPAPAITPPAVTPPPTSGDLDSGLKPTATEPPVIKVDDGTSTAPTPAPPPTTDDSGTTKTP